MRAVCITVEEIFSVVEACVVKVGVSVMNKRKILVVFYIFCTFILICW